MSAQPRPPAQQPDLPDQLSVPREAPDRNLGLELVRVTEAAAMAAGRWVGRGDTNGADAAAVAAMRALISTVRSDNCFVVATGITDGELLRGVRYRGGTIRTQSIVMRAKSGTIRVVDAEHQQAKLAAYAAVDFSGARR